MSQTTEVPAGAATSATAQSQQEGHEGTLPVLLIDDEAGIRDSLSLFLERKGLDVIVAEDGERALDLLEQRKFSLVISDISMPGEVNGLDVLRYVRRHQEDAEVIMMTGHLDVDYAIEALKLGAFDYFKKPFLFEEVQNSLLKALERRRLLEKSRELERLRSRQQAMNEVQTEVMISLAAMIDAKSPYTRAHSERVSGYARYLAEALGAGASDLRKIIIGGKLHDIGKIGTPEHILNKDGKLTEEEWEIIKQHPAVGAELLKPLSIMEPYLPIVRWHHENLDGTGYPDGLTEDQIPREVLIVKIADIYDAITSRRPYRDPMTFKEAADVLTGEIGRGLPEDIVTAFLRMLEAAPWKNKQKAPAHA